MRRLDPETAQVCDFLFSCEGYQAFLRWMIDQHAHVPGYKSRMAEAMHCHKSLLSQILGESSQLTPDHAIALTDFWKLPELAAGFFLDLVNEARAATPRLRAHLRSSLKQARSRWNSIAGRIENPQALSDAFTTEFFSKWYYPAILMGVGTRGREDTDSLSRDLGLPVELVETVLDRLQQMECIRKTDSGWLRTMPRLFLKDNAVRPMFLANWRQQATLALQKSEKESLHFTSLYCLSEERWWEIHRRLLALANEIHESAVDSVPEETTACVNLDFFRF